MRNLAIVLGVMVLSACIVEETDPASSSSDLGGAGRS